MPIWTYPEVFQTFFQFTQVSSWTLKWPNGHMLLVDRESFWNLPNTWKSLERVQILHNARNNVCLKLLPLVGSLIFCIVHKWYMFGTTFSETRILGNELHNRIDMCEILEYKYGCMSRLVLFFRIFFERFGLFGNEHDRSTWLC